VTADLCHDLGISFEERPLSLEECLGADEAMLSSTPFCLAGVSHINGVSLPWPGPIFERLLAAWDRHAGQNVRAQFAAKR